MITETVVNKEKTKVKQERLNLDRLKEVLSYDKETGVFIWRSGAPRRLIGRVAGYVTHHGNRLIGVDGVMYFAHRLAWFYINGGWPKEEIDHKDLNKDNNAISNLREATHSQNGCNKSKLRENTSGYKGVVRHQYGRWQAQIKHNKKMYYLGLFDDPKEAHGAYLTASKELHGEFGRSH